MVPISSGPLLPDTGTTLLLLDPEIVKTYYSQTAGAQFKQTVGRWTYPMRLPNCPLSASVSITATTLRSRDVTWRTPKSSQARPSAMAGFRADLEQPFSILGDIFLKACFAVFDLKNNRWEICGQIPGWPLTAPLVRTSIDAFFGSPFTLPLIFCRRVKGGKRIIWSRGEPVSNDLVRKS